MNFKLKVGNYSNIFILVCITESLPHHAIQKLQKELKSIV